MKLRTKPYGNKNIVGRNIEIYRTNKEISQKDFIAQVQHHGCDINPTSYSKLEGQLRIATDIELYAIAQALQISVDELYITPPIKEKNKTNPATKKTSL